ncbi:MAG: LysM peptidoglycan-binding domain-containing protein [Acidobacteriota bacterium]|nr:LysM peptidoglycan-binding domain-containing protein [Acidobacteriota bacterium]
MIEKYKDLEALAGTLGVQNFSMTEAGGKVSIKGRTTYQLEKDLFWDAIKKHDGWQTEVSADIAAEKTDIHGYHVVQPGESLSKIAKVHLDNANRYMDIFNANKDQLKDPNLIHPGQKLLIPKK